MKKILIANRGEIACRIIRSAKEMGIKTVAVYSEVDRDAMHVRMADEAVCIGPAPSNESYLVQEKIIETALKFNVDGIHPGYGFLSENASFAALVAKNKMTFIGPKTHAIEVMGSKLAAKAAVKGYDIPMVPGTEEAIADVEEAMEIAKNIGFPILIKASAGGGGKGMRAVMAESELKEGMERAISEATSAFGDGSVFIEKLVLEPRHIEIQILADTHGNITYLFERECSIQRRHQKVVEEAPSAILTEALRKRMGEAAVDVARACDYVGAGTVEFLVDKDLNFYFLEMNTRLQVEHPVTEMITGIDLVKAQIRIARGEKLWFNQEDLKIQGHAMELRIYAEDPKNKFLPDIGRLDTYRPAQGLGVRVDDGFEEGMEIPVYYDPMIAKLITWGESREEAIERMKRAIGEYQISGVANTLSFGKFVMNHEAFTSGNFDTGFVDSYFKPDENKVENKEEAQIAALLAVKSFLESDRKSVAAMETMNTGESKWKRNRR